MSQSLLKLQIGPVQNFIAQARTTRDLWSGSYLLSWLMGHAIKVLVEHSGEKSLVFPSSHHQPLLDRLLRPGQGDSNEEEILIPNLPNVLLARLDCDEQEAAAVAKAVAEVFSANQAAPTAANTEWSRICTACLEFLGQGSTAFSAEQRKSWALQTEHHWEVMRQVWPELGGGQLDDAFAALGTEGIRAAAPWCKNFTLVSHRLQSRRQTRDFQASPSIGPRHKDYFSGREDVVADTAWIARARAAKDARGLPFLFRNDDELGAINLIKRVWHKAYLDRVHHLRRARLAFDAVPDVATAPWRNSLRDVLFGPNTPSALEAAWHNFTGAVEAATDLIAEEDEAVAKTIPKGSSTSYGQWNEADPAIFTPSLWEQRPDDPASEPRLAAAREALARLVEAAGLGHPGRYYAVLKLDGDEMGQWLSGAKTGALASAEEHERFSALLSEFAVSTVRPLVEERHHGQLIYAGGDDVLALLPATEAIGCAHALLAQFHALRFQDQPLTASAGLAFGHLKEPLQDLVHEAQLAVERAKARPEREVYDRKAKRVEVRPAEGWNRHALAVSLFKRSGETIRWGTTMLAHGAGEASTTSAAFGLLDYLRRHYRVPVNHPNAEMSISGKFPHRLSELLDRYAIHTPLTTQLLEIARAEVAWAVKQQTQEREGSGFGPADLVQRCELYLQQLFDFHWNDRGQWRHAPRPLREFINLFALEAFIARQAE